jgi:hypothetical protein
MSGSVRQSKVLQAMADIFYNKENTINFSIFHQSSQRVVLWTCLNPNNHNTDFSVNLSYGVDFKTKLSGLYKI